VQESFDSDKLEQILKEIGQLREQARYNEKFEVYQNATQWVVQLAFSLIAAAVVTVIVSLVLRR
jgi:hypothetical protein